MTQQQMLEMLKLLSKHFPITICSDMDGYVITTRLYPTDRYINANHRTFEDTFMMFYYKISEHVGFKLKEEMLEIMK